MIKKSFKEVLGLQWSYAQGKELGWVGGGPTLTEKGGIQPRVYRELPPNYPYNMKQELSNQIDSIRYMRELVTQEEEKKRNKEEVLRQLMK